MGKLQYVDGNDVQLLHCGGEYFASLLQAIESAQREIYLETYIFSHDATASLVRDALIAAALRGVVVRVVIDWLGSGREKALQLSQILIAGGVQCRCFNRWFRRGLARTHRKISVIDQKVAMVGGLNIIDDHISDDGWEHVLPFPRWDFAVQIQGPLVAHVHLEVEAQWRKTGRLGLLSRIALLRNLNEEAHISDSSLSRAALLVRDNLRNRATIQKAYLHALGNAHQHAILVTPYFAPGRKFRRALIAAASRGVEVVLLIGVGQFVLQDAVAHSYYPKLLRQGVRIVEYRKTQLHAKVAVVDNDWATVGSSNFDGLSLFVNHEANIVIHDKAFTAKLSAELQRGVADGVEVFIEDYVNQAWYKRAWYGTAYLVYRALMRLATFGSYG
ncbi:cardiolipin synthase B [Undibacterium jejuense]|uniref:Cardiolipin synthase B n=1 Tax=Undibacterium jejuense TaxID=1344949 RepID=A0A923KNZ6_9BURK|nr:phospholipase D-like domain-containing protein [Undibacterium jejuense]MBC3861131.1 cardiolipin synthase B [Undibacterium jejuense]